ncbi:MAG: ABC-type transport auxiliary lipoprotein family protein [Desulfobacterales bacterium]|nr:ABC-type transport auxiliary lipoprotein family protein [Desulfobacterales bacterium]
MQNWNHRHVYAILIVFLLTLTGCFGNQGPSQPIKFYQLDYPPPAVSFNNTPLPFVLRVDPFQPSGLYNTQKIIYQEDQYAAAQYAYHQWILPPDQMVPRFLVRDFKAADMVRAVFFNGGEAATHRLVGNLEAFYEDDRPAQWQAKAAVSLTLMDMEKRNIAEQICFQKTYTVEKPCDENTPAAFVDAISRAMAEISEMAVTDIYHALLDAQGQ